LLEKEGGLERGREGKREVIGRGRVTGPNSWAPAASESLRNKQTNKQTEKVI
jgi:hypothetical protein